MTIGKRKMLTLQRIQRQLWNFLRQKRFLGSKNFPATRRPPAQKKNVDFNVDVACFAIHTIIGGTCPLTRRIYRAARANTLYLKSIVVEEGVHIEQLTNTTGSDTGKTGWSANNLTRKLCKRRIDRYLG